jgi:chromosome segregation ATPase
MADTSPNSTAAIIASVATLVVGLYAATSTFLLGKRAQTTDKEKSEKSQDATVTVAAMSTLQQIVTQLTVADQRHDVDIQALRSEVDSERKQRHALEDEVAKLKRVIDQKERMIDKLQHEMSERRSEWQETVQELHDENLYLKNSLKKLQVDSDAAEQQYQSEIAELKAEIEQLRQQINAQDGNR